MASEEDIAKLQERLTLHRSTLAVYLQQQALVGHAHTPSSISVGIYEAREEIARIKSILRKRGVAVEDHPVDSEVSLEDISNQQQLLAAYRKAVQHLLRQVAQYGGEAFSPVAIYVGIREARENIAQIKSFLRRQGVHVENHPGDDDEIVTFSHKLEYGHVSTHTITNLFNSAGFLTYYKHHSTLSKKYLIVIFNLLSILVTLALAITIYPHLAKYQSPFLTIGVVLFSTIFLYISSSSYREIKEARLDRMKQIIAESEPIFHLNVDRDISAILAEEVE